MKRLLPTSEQDFGRLRREGFVYVDKTRFLWDLVEMKGQYFLSRPRRFGKSLFISTIEAYFRGEKELFHGLTIEDLENSRGTDAWAEYPVIPFYLSSGMFYTSGGLEARLAKVLSDAETRYGITSSETDLSVRFYSDIEELYKKTDRPVVVLVDEYDKPLLAADSKEQEEKNRALYKSFFSVLKDQSRYLKFVFFTGVTKFSKVSIFSDLNQLKDISMVQQFSGICGITEKELQSTFEPEIKAMAEKQEISYDDCLMKLKEMYDGYHFSIDSDGVYNPYSLLNALSDMEFGNYWFESATPTVLIKKLKGTSLGAEQFDDGVDATEKEIKDYRDDNPNPVPLLYQSGYLTIKEYNKRFETFSLGFPNMEVKYGFLNSLVPYVIGERDSEHPLFVRNIVLALEKGDTDRLYDQLYSIFAGIPYIEGEQPTYEQVWRNQIYLIFELAGEYVTCEQHTAHGRSDCVIETPDYIYIMEFKIDKSADEALTQIEAKDYSGKYKADGRQIIKIGADFSSKDRNIDDWKVR